MTDASELKRLRALVEWYQKDLEERMTWFMAERAHAEKRIYELTTERDRLVRGVGATTGAEALALAVLAYHQQIGPTQRVIMEGGWKIIVELAERVVSDMIGAGRCQRVTTSSN